MYHDNTLDSEFGSPSTLVTMVPSHTKVENYNLPMSRHNGIIIPGTPEPQTSEPQTLHNPMGELNRWHEPN
jgi:hypothetical protein